MSDNKVVGKKMLSFRSQTNKTNVDLSAMVFGKVQPQAIELEQAVLGALMLEKTAISLVIDILRPESFYDPKHEKIFQAISNLFQKLQAVDLLTVTEELRKTGELESIGGPYMLVQLTNRVASAANVEFHARIVAERYIQRELIRVSTEIITDSYQETNDVFDLLDKAESSLFAITEKNLSRGVQPVSSLLAKAVKQVEELSQKTDGLTGVPSGFLSLDRLTSGWQSSDLIIVAARPAMGKTAFTLALARNAAMDFGMSVAFFSLEMAAIQLVNRLISMETELPAEKLRTGKLEGSEWQQLHAGIEKLSDVPIYIDDTPGINIFELRAKCRRLKMQHDIKIIIIDYLQLMTGNGDTKGNREQEISQISRALKGLAKELHVPVIALSQLSRAVESRGGTKKPMLSDLRESGAIEQDADIVSFIYRAEYYQLDTLEDGSPSAGAAEIIVAKHRNGAVDSVKLGWNKNLAKFCNYDDLMGGGGGGMNFLNPGSFGNNAGGGYEDFESVQSKANNQSIAPINDMPF